MGEVTDAEGVIAVIDAFGRCLTARDLEGSMALLADDPALTVIPSEGVDVHRGPQDVRAFLDRIYRSPTRYAWRWHERWVSGDQAQASFVAIGDEIVEGDGDRRVMRYCLTGTLVRRDGRWQILLLHGSEAPAD